MQTIMTQDKSTSLPPFFDKNPEIKKRLEEHLKTVSAEEKKKNFELFHKFVTGEMTWAEVIGYPKFLLKELAHYAYLKFKMKDYQKAEELFKGLAVMDHSNWYYRSALGAVYQKQKRYEQAIDEYSIALELKSDDVASLVNRAECFMVEQDFDAAMEDIAAVEKLGLPDGNSWKKRAQLISQRVLMLKSKGEA